MGAHSFKLLVAVVDEAVMSAGLRQTDDDLGFLGKERGTLLLRDNVWVGVVSGLEALKGCLAHIVCLIICVSDH